MNEPKKKRSVRGRILRVLLILIALAVLGYGALVGYTYYREVTVAVPTAADYDSIIVLGAQVKPDGTPSVQLRWRLDKAEEMYALRPCPVVACGAQGGGEPAPEGQVMRELMIADGLPEDQIYAETLSDDTQANIQNAKAILDGLGCTRPLIVTSDYHLPRALEIAGDAGVADPQGAGSLCRNELGFWLKNHCREALAWVKYWGIKYLHLPL